MKHSTSWAAAFLALIVGLFLIVERQPGQSEFCTVCGAAHLTTTWKIRSTAIHLWSSRQEEATPFSSVLTEKNLVVTHSHQWLAPRVIPDPLNEFGPPVTESLGLLNTPRVVSFVRNMADFADETSRRLWRERLLSPEFSYVFDDSLRFMRVPEVGFPQREQFDAWSRQYAVPLYARLLQETTAD